MNRKDIINKVREIFGWNQFGIYKNAEGVEFRIDEMEVEKDIYIITPEGELPAPDGEIELEDGTKIGVMEGKIRNFMLPVMDEETEEEFDEAELEDGTKVMTDGAGFEVGQKLYVIDAENQKVQAPEGTHNTQSGIELVVDAQGVLTGVRYPDEDGEGSLDMEKDTKMAEAKLVDGTIVETEGELAVGVELYVITEEGKQLAPDADHETDGGMIITTKDGIITEIKDKEDAAGTEMEVMQTFTRALEQLNKEISNLRKENQELKSKFSKFASEPAGEKIYDGRGAYIAMTNDLASEKLERLAKLRRTN
jgi:hypothetical protein